MSRTSTRERSPRGLRALRRDGSARRDLIGLALLASLAVPASAAAQAIGHPAGALPPRSSAAASDGYSDDRPDAPSSPEPTLFGGLELGAMRQWAVDVDYSAAFGPPGERGSDISEVYGAVAAAFVIPLSERVGLELDGALGWTSQSIEDGAAVPEPFDDTFGNLLSLGARAGWAPVSPLRLGLGFRATGTHATDVMADDFLEDVADLLRGEYSDPDTRELWLLRTQVFLGGGVDLELSPDVVLSPYGGAGLAFAFGELSIVRDYMQVFDSETLGTARIREGGLAVGFGGLDLRIALGEEASPSTLLVRAEGQTDGEGWFVGIGAMLMP